MKGHIEVSDRSRRVRPLVRSLGAVVMAAAIAFLGIAATPPSQAAAAEISQMQKVANTALAQVGNNYSPYGYDGNWCAAFATWVWKNSYASINIGAGELGSSVSSFETYGNASHHNTLSYTPHVGDAVVFDNRDGYVLSNLAPPKGYGAGIQHVGIVTAILNGGTTIQTVEGNVGSSWGISKVTRVQYYAAPHQRPYMTNGKPLPSGSWEVKEYISPDYNWLCGVGKPC